MWIPARLPPLLSALPSAAQLEEPPVKEARLTGARGWAFSVVALLFWNVLPLEARLASRLLSLSKYVKMELFKWSFNMGLFY